jgi:hypothetical protein
MRGVAHQSIAVALFVAFFISAFAVLADTAGPNGPGTAVNNASFGTQAWSNPARVADSDDSRASAGLGDNEVSQFVKVTNFSFSIPANAVIDGIVVDVERQVNDISGGSIVRDAAVRLVKNGTILAADRATNSSWNTTDVVESHGNASDLWNATWTAEDINALDFGAAVAAMKANALAGNRQARIDRISIVVQYHLPDTAPPNITLNGGDETVEYGANYTDAGANALDDVDGNLTANITAISTVNTSALGVFTVTYAVADLSGNNATATRNVTVVDTTPPAITVSGPNPFTMDAEKPYTDWGASAVDAAQGDVSGAIVVVNNVATGQGGTYTVDYFVNDSAGNNATASRTVTVVPDTQHGKGPNAFSYFAKKESPRSESAAETSAPAASAAPAAAPSSDAPQSSPAASEAPAQASMAISAAVPEAAFSDVPAPSVRASRDASITGAVAGVLREANPAWLAVAGALVLGLLGVAKFSARKSNPEKERANALRKWKL